MATTTIAPGADLAPHLRSLAEFYSWASQCNMSAPPLAELTPENQIMWRDNYEQQLRKALGRAAFAQPAAQVAAWEARRYCKGDGEWSTWKPISDADYVAHKSDSSFQFRATPATVKTAEGE